MSLQLQEATRLLSTKPLDLRDKGISRVTKAMKRIKREAVDPAASENLCQELNCLNLCPYLDEVCQSLIECISPPVPPSKLNSSVEPFLILVFVVHLTYPQFCKILAPQLFKLLREQIASSSPRQRVTCRIFTELVLNEETVFASYKLQLLRILKNLLEGSSSLADRVSNISFLSYWTSKFSGIFLEELLPTARNFVSSGSANALIEEIRKELKLEEDARFKIIIEGGELPTDGGKGSIKEISEKLKTSFDLLSSFFSIEFPSDSTSGVNQSSNLHQHGTGSSSSSGGSGSTGKDASIQQTVPISPFKDDEERILYSLPIFEVCSSPSKKFPNQFSAEEEKEIFMKIANFRKNSDVDSLAKRFLESSFIQNSTKKFRSKFARLFNHSSSSVSILLLRFFSMLFSSNKEFFLSIISDLRENISIFFSSSISFSSNQISYATSSMKILCELCRFEIFPGPSVLDLIQVLLDAFNPQTAELVSLAFSVCGRYLLSHPSLSVSARADNLLERLHRLKNAKDLPPRVEALVEDSYYFLRNSGTRISSVSTGKDESEIIFTEFFRKIIFVDFLSGDCNEQKLLDLLERVEATGDVRAKLAWKFVILEMGEHTPFESLPLLACFLNSALKKRSNLRHAVFDLIDDLFENIQVGVEDDGMKKGSIPATRRFREIAFLGELYNEGVLGDLEISNTLFQLIGFGGPSSFGASEFDMIKNVILNKANAEMQKNEGKNNKKLLEKIQEEEDDEDQGISSKTDVDDQDFSRTDNKKESIHMSNIVLNQIFRSCSPHSVKSWISLRLCCELIDVTGEKLLSKGEKIPKNLLRLFWTLFERCVLVLTRDGNLPIPLGVKTAIDRTYHMWMKFLFQKKRRVPILCKKNRFDERNQRNFKRITIVREKMALKLTENDELIEKLLFSIEPDNLAGNRKGIEDSNLEEEEEVATEEHVKIPHEDYSLLKRRVDTLTEDFDIEFAKLMTESVELVKKNQNQTRSVPTLRRPPMLTTQSDDFEDSSFHQLTFFKKGDTAAKGRQVYVPSDSKLWEVVEEGKKRTQEEQLDRKEIKRIILDQEESSRKSTNDRNRRKYNGKRVVPIEAGVDIETVSQFD